MRADSYDAALERIDTLAYTSNVETNDSEGEDPLLPPAKKSRGDEIFSSNTSLAKSSRARNHIASSTDEDVSEENDEMDNSATRSPRFKKPVGGRKLPPTPSRNSKEPSRNQGTPSPVTSRKNKTPSHNQGSPPPSPDRVLGVGQNNLATVVASLGTRLSGI